MNISTEQVFLVNSADLEQQNHTPALVQRTFALHVAAVHPEDPQSSSMCVPQSMGPQTRSQMCRLCATLTEMVVPIFEGEGLQNGLADKIHQHLPIRVSEKDVLPVVVCFQCTSTLLAWHELVVCCVQADAAMRERLHLPHTAHSTQQDEQPAEQSSQTEIKHEKSPIGIVIKSTLTNYIHSLNMDEQVMLVCHKCDDNPAFTRDDFAKHLAFKHDLKNSDEGDVISFIIDNVTFEEALVFDTESNRGTDSDSEVLNDSKTPVNILDVRKEKDVTEIPLPLTWKQKSLNVLDTQINNDATVIVKAVEETSKPMTNTQALKNPKQKNIFTELLEALKRNRDQEGSELQQDGDDIQILDVPDTEATEMDATEAQDDATDVKNEMPNQVCLPTLLCSYCDSAFSSPTRLLHHLGTHREISIDNGVRCCDVTYTTKNDFVTHLQQNHVNRLIYDPETMCKSCSFRADTTDELKTHIQSRHSEKKKPHRKKKESPINQKFIPAVCPECNETFCNKYSMLFHLKMHTGRDTFKCEKCDKEYSTKGNLAQHVKLAHEGRLPHACGSCGERFPTRGARDIHSRLHTGEKPFRCHICDASFRANNTLLRHLDVHLDVRKHACPVCNKMFRKSSHATAHARVHHQQCRVMTAQSN